MLKTKKSIYLLTSISLFLLCAFWINYCSAQSTTKQPLAIVLNVKSAITPAVKDYIQDGLNAAKQQQASIVVLQLNTPGGLYSSTRDIVEAILASQVPVAVFVAPSGAHAASAGTFIIYAAQIAAMAPGTHLGAATPIELNSKESQRTRPSTAAKKAISDAKAYIRSLAQLRGRNADWAQRAVSQSASLSADEALKQHVINIIADNVPQLLNNIAGHTVKVNNQPQVLHVKNATIQEFQPSWRVQFLTIITDPNVAYLIFLLGIFGLFFELLNPGFILPGVVGVICLLLGLYAFHLLPIDYAGLGLLLVGVAFLVAEAFVSSYGALGIGGIIAFAIGSIMLFDKGMYGYSLAWSVIVAATLVTAAFFLFIIGMAIKSRFRPVVSGADQLIGNVGEIIHLTDGQTQMRLQGEIWQVQCAQPLQMGQKVKVIGRDGLILKVETIN